MRIKFFLAGDVMTGRGIDQILPHPSHPRIYEPFMGDAREYVALAEDASGKIDYPVAFDYIWGDALSELKKARPDLRIINLETTITKSENYLPKGINYRMNPENIEVLKILGADACVLANNHILDWGSEGLLDTIGVLREHRIQTVGAGIDAEEAKEPAIFHLEKGKVITLAYAHISSGVLVKQQAEENRPGLNFLTELSEKEIAEIRKEISDVKQKEDFVVLSIHWGPNWGYRITEAFIRFAHQLIDAAGVDLVFGHSSHHFKGFEIYRNKLILYGAGDFINDYEGIKGYEEFRDDLTLMYFPEIDLEEKSLIVLTVVPMQIRKLQLISPRPADIDWSLNVLQRESRFEGQLIKTNDRRIVYDKTCCASSG
jgi:poly-gamma-glutamate capsule biosynthesis protein CapA/YwtB (metallophosphatase superfamily)